MNRSFIFNMSLLVCCVVVFVHLQYVCHIHATHAHTHIYICIDRYHNTFGYIYTDIVELLESESLCIVLLV